VQLVDAAILSLDIVTPSASPWTFACSTFGQTGCATGCDPGTMRADPFPLFGAILNALHRGVSVRILTNGFGLPDCGTQGNLTLLTFLALNGAEVRYYATTTFVHAKWLAADARDGSIPTNGSSSYGGKVAVSSVNWSRSSLSKNREAGAVLAGLGSAPAAAFMAAVFAADFAAALPAPLNTSFYSAAQLDTIRDADPVPVVVPPPPHVPGGPSGCYVYNSSAALPLPDGSSLVAFASPDHSYAELTRQLNSATSTLEIYMCAPHPHPPTRPPKRPPAQTSPSLSGRYQIDGEMCNFIESLARTKPSLSISLLLSPRIYDDCDCGAARACYARLAAAGLSLRKSAADCFPYTHNKIWIVDGTSVGWSTGNMSPSDFSPPAEPGGGAGGADVYPPYGEQGWTKINRDFSIYVTSADGEGNPLVQTFRALMQADAAAGGAGPWSPSTDVQCG